MNLETTCPSCSRRLVVPESLLGQPVKCPSCGKVFNAESGIQEAASSPRPPAPTAPPPPPPIAKPIPEDRPLEQPASDGHACPYCNARLTAKDLDDGWCDACGKKLPSYVASPRPRRSGEFDRGGYEERGGAAGFHEIYDRPSAPWARGHRGGAVLTLGIVSIAVPMTLCFCCGGWTGALGVGFGLASWIMGAADLAKMRTGDMDRSGEGQTRAGYVCGIIGTVLGVLLLLCAVGGTLLMLSGNAAPFGAPGAFGGKGGRF